MLIPVLPASNAHSGLLLRSFFLVCSMFMKRIVRFIFGSVKSFLLLGQQPKAVADGTNEHDQLDHIRQVRSDIDHLNIPQIRRSASAIASTAATVRMNSIMSLPFVTASP